MPKKENKISRRNFFVQAGQTAVTAAYAANLSWAPKLAAADQPKRSEPKSPLKKSRPSTKSNILYIFTDQERYFKKLPRGLSLPGHERLAKMGTTFHNHYIASVMCSPSRSIMMTGLQTINNGIFENVDMPWVKKLSTKIPTYGHMLRKAGFYTAYKGKWHLNHDMDVHQPNRLFTKEMDEYGFSDYYSPGDIVGHTLGGYHFDNLIAESAITWLRKNGQPLNDQNKPWSLTVSLVNPHDIMYLNTDPKGINQQDTGKLLIRSARVPNHPLFKKDWDVSIPSNLKQSLKEMGRPLAHFEYQEAWDQALGHIPPEEELWRNFNNFYINCLRTADMNLMKILDELENLGLMENTIIVYSSDHGEMAGAHGLRGKGPFPYEECIHVPLYVVHPDVRGNNDCYSLTSHIDLAPTFLSLAGASSDQAIEYAGQKLPGKDLSGVIGDPKNSSIHSARDGILFTYSGLSTVDSDLIKRAVAAKMEGKSPKSVMESGFKPNLKKRGTVRTFFDGRYKFTRYFSPLEHHKPIGLDKLYSLNDVELYDLNNDSLEMQNLAFKKGQNDELANSLNEKLENIITAEMGLDDGRELPKFKKMKWAIENLDA